jgi:hypothetical protein
MKKRKNNYTLPKNLFNVFLDLVPKSKTKRFTKSNIQIYNMYIHRIRTGCQYRELGSDWENVYYRVKKWEKLGLIEEILKMIHRHLKLFESEEYILIIDSQTIQNTKYSREGGYDGNKKLYGLKRCPLVDIKGNLLDIFVYPASAHERFCLEESLRILKAKEAFKNKKIYIYADKGFFGKEYTKRLESEFSISLKIMEIDYHDINKVNAKTKEKWKDMLPLAKEVYQEESKLIKARNKEKSQVRNVVERYFAWLRDYRLLNMNYERYFSSHRTDCKLASATIILRRAYGSSSNK